MQSNHEDRRQDIKGELLGPHRLLRIGSLPKWINPKTDAEDVSPSVQLQRLLVADSDVEPDRPSSAHGTSDRAPILRKSKYTFERTRSLDDIKRPDSPSQDRSEVRWVENATMTAKYGPSSYDQLCKTCRGINFENMASENGYDHLLLQDLIESKSSCRMCQFIYHQIDSKMEDHTPNRYRIRLSLYKNSPRTEGYRDDHYTTSDYMYDREFSSCRVEAMDLRPWEPPENYKVRYSYENSPNPEKYLEPRGSSPKSVRSKTVHCFTEEHDPARQLDICWIRNIGTNTASASSFEIARAWLSKCLSSENPSSSYRLVPHDSIRVTTIREATETSSTSLPQTFEEERPARLLQITETHAGNLGSHVIDTKNDDYRYAALSYCWGPQKTEEGREWQLTRANEVPHHENINVDKLPRTVRDGISIAWQLGIEYVWIDALCIVQDSASDWAREAAKMGGIYLGSLVTIAVSASASVKDGCFNSTSERTTELQSFEDLTIVKGRLQDGQESCLYFLDYAANIPDMYQKEVVNGPLSKRAWTFQEHVLPRRILYFTSKQLLWECTHCRLSEDHFPQIQSSRPYPILDFEYTLDENKIASFWYIGAVEQYSRRQMTFEKDKLVAISALARATHNNRQADYIAGLWRDSLTLGLTWCRSSNGHKSTTFECPSWSWASQNSEISYRIAAQVLQDLDHRYLRGTSNRDDQNEADPARPSSQIINVHWKPDMANTFGNVSDAHIDLRTILSTGIVVRDHFSHRLPHGLGWEYSQAILIPYTSPSGKAEWWPAKATMDDSGAAGAHVTVALLREPTTDNPVFLLLVPSDLVAKTFRRVGLAELNDINRNGERDLVELTQGWTRQTIRLV
jgi:hypothetical protein